MSNWRDDYFAALEARDKIEKADVEIYQAYTRLADRTAELSKRPEEESRDRELPQSPASTTGRKPSRVISPSPGESLPQIRLDLAKAQQERGDLQARLDAATRELETVRTKAKTDSKRIQQLSTGVTQMTVRLRDRDEELKGKAKLVEDVQDEMVTLNLQLNMAEEQTEKLKRENEELIERWMAKKKKEADAMNDRVNQGTGLKDRSS